MVIKISIIAFGLLIATCYAAPERVGSKRPGPIQPARDTAQSLFLSNPYNSGDWGEVELCPDGSFVNAIEVKYNEPGHLDETAVNGIKLYCTTPDEHDVGYVQSSVGSHGDWYGMNICSDGNFLTGMRANVLSHQGAFTDDVAVENIDVDCNYGAEILHGLPIAVPRENNAETYDFKPGTWGSFDTCLEGLAVCGIQTRYEDASLGDETAITDMVFYCCDTTAV